ncbi:MAG: type VI secretion system tube protein Hcp, partial [Acidobacteriota bacterium]|nr:type VI secretion system tube protein Hcp [Acidobacteriota bacterium]
AAAPDPTPRARVVGTVTLMRLSGGTTVKFDIYDFASGFQQSPPSGTGGAGAGRVLFEPITMTIVPDSATPQLFTWLATGVHLYSAEVQLYGKVGTTVLETFLYRTVILTALSTTNGGAATDSLFEQLTLKAGTAIQTVAGSHAGWNSITNVPA